tara:strand:+ start:649 stop:804 length:156 start_codon:yes stop_codon:yes gene_type:complete
MRFAAEWQPNETLFRWQRLQRALVLNGQNVQRVVATPHVLRRHPVFPPLWW